MTAGKNQLNLHVYRCITVIIHRLFASLIKNKKPYYAFAIKTIAANIPTLKFNVFAITSVYTVFVLLYLTSAPEFFCSVFINFPFGARVGRDD